MKRICFFSGDITRPGGTERAASIIANELSQNRDYKILFLSLVEQNAEPFFPLNKSIERYHLSEKWLKPGVEYLPLVSKVRHFSLQHEIDLFIDIDIVLDAISYLALKNTKIKIISWEHFNYTYEDMILYRKLIRNLFTSKTDGIVTLTEADANVYRKHFCNKKIWNIHNPILVSEGKYSSEKREKWILSVGHLIYRKGVDMMAEIGCTILEENPEWKWIVLGDGDCQPMLKETIDKHGLTDRFILEGRVKNVGWYLERARLMVLTSRSEGLPMCLLEALEFNVPSVSFDIKSGPSEIIKDCETGYLIPPFDCKQMTEKINYLLRNTEQLEQFAKNTSNYISVFHIKRIMEEWNEILENLLAE